MKIGLIGYGNIGRFLLQSINHNHLIKDGKITAISGRNPELGQKIADEYDAEYIQEVNQLIESDVDLVIEAATVEVVKKHAAAILKSGKDFLVISVGALADQSFYEQLHLICEKFGTKLLLPSGAIGGLDILKAAKSIGQLETVSITTRKPPKALPGAPLDQETVLFSGCAEDAIQKFPQNINVSIILSLAGIGPAKTAVTIIADPKVDKNNHTIEASGSFGKLSVKVENDPMPENPKTSYLAVLSVISALQSKDALIQMG
ncbi:aspartate dehydrogenase [Niallia endozanthoxylica]|uniref:L-aspartate dehydrogenase n=1 Tax=Niallia endozanthoxylica TaxID=2036016 RepID=A0A5J5H5L4_9BACI|nr:aspartate dehydrogenase [Niallia endozanthoxylica]KAA9015965.1 aspartate dehydrogenase [Niallia endozanthoxylica]